jgi:hypothetical protein
LRPDRAPANRVTGDTGDTEGAEQQASLLLPLLKRLTDASSSWAVWKNIEAALTGTGDVDCVTPQHQWSLIEEEVRNWAGTRALDPVVACRHVPGALFLVAVDQEQSLFHQLDIRARATFRGATVFRADDLMPLFEMDARGFRRLRPGAEGLLKLVINGTGRAGAHRIESLVKEHVAELLAQDPAGASAAASLFGPVQGAVRRGAERAATGRWDRPAMLAVEAWARTRALAAPSVLVGQVAVRRAKRTCPVLQAGIYNARKIPGNQQTWLAAVANTHDADVAGPRRARQRGMA